MSGAVPPPAARPLERAARVPLPVCPGCGRCGRVDPALAPQRAPLRAGVARCGGGGRASPGGGAFRRCEGRLVSGAVPPPAARPLEQAARVPVCVCVRVRALLGRVGRAGLPGAFWCASPFHLAALSFCFAWPPPGWGCPPLSRCCCLSALPWRFVFFFFFFSASRYLVGLCLPLGPWLLVGGCSPAPLPFCVPRFLSLLLGAWVLFFFFFLVLLSPCAPVVSGFLWFPASGALGLGACVVCFVGLPSLGSPCVCPSFVLSAWLLAAPWWLLPPPPPLFLAVFVAAARCCVPCCAVRPWVRRCAALLRVVSPGVVLSCAVLRSFVAPCPLALPVALGPCALRRCVLRCSPALCALCCVCFVVARWCVLLFAALLCAVCVPGCCAVCSLCSPLCAVLCFAVLVRSRCAVRVVRAVAGAWRCGALLCVVLLPVVCRGAVLGLLARGCLLVACFGVGVPVWPRGLLPCGWCGLLWCPAFLCRVLWCCAVAWCCAVVLCCRVAVLLGLALPSCGLSCCAVLCCWLAVLFFARWWCLRAVVLFSSCGAFPVFSALCAAVPCCAGCGALLPCVVCCGAVLSCGAVLPCSAVVLRCCLCFLCPPAARRAAPVLSALLLVPRAVACPCALWCLPGRSAVWWCRSGVSWCLAVLCVVLWCPNSTRRCLSSCGVPWPVNDDVINF